MNFVTLREKCRVRGDKSKFHDIPIGSTVKATLRITEGDKSRNQSFEGLLIKKRKARKTTTFTLRKISFGVGVEKIIPLDSPALVKMEVTSQHKVRRSKLYFLRDLSGKSSKLHELYGAKKQDLSYLETELGPAGTAAAQAPEAAPAKAKADAGKKDEKKEAKKEAKTEKPAEKKEAKPAQAPATPKETKSDKKS